MSIELKNRLYSLLWRVGGMVLVVILDGLLKLLTDGTIQVPAPYIVLAGLIVGEISKLLKNKGVI